MSYTRTRRQFLWQAAGAAAAWALPGPARPLRGVFPILATPFTAGNAVDFEDLAKEVRWLDRCGVHGMVWPQLASEYSLLSKAERLRGMEVIASAAKGLQPALVLGVQGPNTAAALEFVEKAESLAPDALIAIPPAEARTLADFQSYYEAIAKAARRPVFIQTTGGPRGLQFPVEAVLDLARRFENLRHVKEEFEPVIPRMQELARHRDVIQGVFSGNHGRAMLYEMALGFDGTMPGPVYADVHAQVWSLYQAGQKEKAREVFARLLLMLHLEQQIPAARRYLMKKRGVFKTSLSRRDRSEPSPEEIREIEFQFEALKPYLQA
jgi:dihydrodipicolinate synthase/N-acetylneuraminate lyase